MILAVYRRNSNDELSCELKSQRFSRGLESDRRIDREQSHLSEKNTYKILMLPSTSCVLSEFRILIIGRPYICYRMKLLILKLLVYLLLGKPVCSWINVHGTAMEHRAAHAAGPGRSLDHRSGALVRLLEGGAEAGVEDGVRGRQQRRKRHAQARLLHEGAPRLDALLETVGEQVRGLDDVMNGEAGLLREE